MTASCGWLSRSHVFDCTIAIPRRVRVRLGRSNRYTVTAYEACAYTGFVVAPGEPTAWNPDIFWFSR